MFALICKDPMTPCATDKQSVTVVLKYLFPVVKQRSDKTPKSQKRYVKHNETRSTGFNTDTISVYRE